MAKKKQRLVVDQCNDRYEYHSPFTCDACYRKSNSGKGVWTIGRQDCCDIICCTGCLKSLRSQINTPMVKNRRVILLKEIYEEKGITEDSICDTCDKVVKYNTPMWGIGCGNQNNIIVFCNQCLKSLHSQIDALRILAISGKDTK